MSPKSAKIAVTNKGEYSEKELKALPTREVNIAKYAELVDIPVGDKSLVMQIEEGSSTEKSTYYQSWVIINGEVIQNRHKLYCKCPNIKNQKEEYADRLKKIEAMSAPILPNGKPGPKPKAYPPKGDVGLFYREADAVKMQVDNLFKLWTSLDKHYESYFKEHMGIEYVSPIITSVNKLGEEVRGIKINMTVLQDPETMGTDDRVRNGVVYTRIYDYNTKKDLKMDCEPNTLKCETREHSWNYDTYVHHNNVHKAFRYCNLLSPMLINTNIRVPLEIKKGEKEKAITFIKTTEISVNGKHWEELPSAGGIEKYAAEGDEHARMCAASLKADELDAAVSKASTSNSEVHVMKEEPKKSTRDKLRAKMAAMPSRDDSDSD